MTKKIIEHKDLPEYYQDHVLFCKKIGRPDIVFIEDENGTIRYQEKPIMRYMVDNIDLNQMTIDCYNKQFTTLEFIYLYQDIGYSLCGFEEVWGEVMNKVLGIIVDPETGKEISRKPEDEKKAFLINKKDEDFSEAIDAYGKMTEFLFSEPTEVFILEWGARKFGFGEFTFYFNKEKKLCCDNECMSKKFVKKALCAMVDNCKFVNE